MATQSNRSDVSGRSVIKSIPEAWLTNLVKLANDVDVDWLLDNVKNDMARSDVMKVATLIGFAQSAEYAGTDLQLKDSDTKTKGNSKAKGTV